MGKEKYEKLKIKYRLDGVADMDKEKLKELQNILNKGLKIDKKAIF